MFEEDGLLQQEQNFLMDFAHSKEWKNLMIINLVLLLFTLAQNIWLMTIDYAEYLDLSIQSSTANLLLMILLIIGTILFALVPLSLIFTYIGGSKQNGKMMQVGLTFIRAYLLLQMFAIIMLIAGTIIIGILLLFRSFLLAVFIFALFGGISYVFFKLFSIALNMVENISNRLKGFSVGLKTADDFLKFYQIFYILYIVALAFQLVALLASLGDGNSSSEWALAMKIDAISFLSSILTFFALIYSRKVFHLYNSRFITLASPEVVVSSDPDAWTMKKF